jgi:two-component system, LytTR family, sensor kinase
MNLPLLKRVNPSQLILPGVIIAGILILVVGYRMDNILVLSLGHTGIMTGGIWLYSLTFVKFLWLKFPWEKQPNIHIILEVTGIGLFTVAYTFIVFEIESFFLPIDLKTNVELQYVIVLLITYLITGIHEMKYFYDQWMSNFSRSIKLEKDHIQAKYESLKTQINPHFLFNSLNSLADIVEEKEEAVNYIQNLSGFLRYILASKGKDLVYVEEELDQLNSYYELQKLRFGENLVLDVTIEEKYMLFVIPPLVLQMLVENAIKHNIISSESELRITIEVVNESIRVKNNLQQKEGVESTGQGLNNIRDRYRHFSGKEVAIDRADDYFSVSLPLLKIKL